MLTLVVLWFGILWIERCICEYCKKNCLNTEKSWRKICRGGKNVVSLQRLEDVGVGKNWLIVLNECPVIGIG